MTALAVSGSIELPAARAWRARPGLMVIGALVFCAFVYLGPMLSLLGWAFRDPNANEPHAGRKLPGDSVMEIVGDRFAGRDCLPVRERRHIEIEVFAVERSGHLFRKDAVEKAEIHHHARDRIDLPADRNGAAIVVGVAGLSGAFAESGAVLFG